MEQKQIGCPKCHVGNLIERKGVKGVFLGCNNYPNCKHTQNLDTEQKVAVKPFNAEKTYHLTPEQVRYNALDIALRKYPNLDTPGLCREAEVIEKWMLR